MITEVEVFRFFVTHPRVMKKFLNRLQGVSEGFVNSEVRLLWDWMSFHWRRYSKSPTWDWFWWALNSNQNIPEDTKDSIGDLLNLVENTQTQLNYDAVFQFFFEMENYRIQQASMQSDWTQWDEEIRERKRAMELLDAIKDPESVQGVHEILRPFSQEELHKAWDMVLDDQLSRITTGHDCWDWSSGGGFKAGTYNVIHAKSDGGKTLVLSDLAVGPLEKTDWVRSVFFALDLNTREMLPRLMARVAAIPLGEERDLNREIYEHRIRNSIRHESWGDRFWLVRWPRGEITAQQIIEQVQEIEEWCKPIDVARGVCEPGREGEVDLVVVDALNNIKHVGDRTDETRHKWDKSCLSFASHAERTDKVYLLGVQANRMGNHVDSLTDQFVGEAHSIKQHANQFCSIAQKQQEKISKRIRLNIDKMKSHNNGVTFHMHYIPRLMRILLDETIGVTYHDGTPHREWVNAHPHLREKLGATIFNPDNEPEKKKRKQVKPDDFGSGTQSPVIFG